MIGVPYLPTNYQYSLSSFHSDLNSFGSSDSELLVIERLQKVWTQGDGIGVRF